MNDIINASTLATFILFADDNIGQVDHTKCLGVIINYRLNWNDHIKTVCTKVNTNTGILYRTRKNLNTSTLLLPYQILIQPLIEYCNIIWSCWWFRFSPNTIHKAKESGSINHLWKMELSYCVNLCKATNFKFI